MNKTDRQNIKPTSNCQYGKQCYRKNPQHFLEYRHEHLDKIIESNRTANSVQQYNIPSEFLPDKDLILDQIKILNEQFPRQTDIEPAAKRTKAEETASVQSNAVNSPAVKSKATSTPTNDRSNGNNERVASTSAAPVAPSPAPSQKATAMPKMNIHDYVKVVNPKGRMAQKLENARPYNYFLTCITSSPKTHTEPLSITFQEILDPSLGDLECSVQINFMVDAGWLLG